MSKSSGLAADGQCCPPGSLLREPLTATAAGEMAVRFKALADPVRLQLFSAIASHEGGEACVCDVSAGLEVSQPRSCRSRVIAGGSAVGSGSSSLISASTSMKLLHRRSRYGILVWSSHAPQDTSIRRQTCDCNSYMVIYPVHLLLVRSELAC